MLSYLPYAVVSLLGIISLGWGGHSPWSMLLLELGAIGLLLCVLLQVLLCTGPEARSRNLEQRRAWRKLPFRVRHPRLASFMRLLKLGLLPSRRSTPEIEILLPGRQQAAPEEVPEVDSVSFTGYRFRRARVVTPLLLITLWITASLLPLSRDWLQRVSPHALSIRSAAESLVQLEETPTAWPWSLASFLTERALCLWVAYLALFYVSVCVAADPKRVERLTRLLFVAVVAAGSYGAWQWFSGVRESLGVEPSFAGIRASGSFGNPNHYAATMEMLLLCSLGWIGYQLAPLAHTAGPSRGLLSRARVMRQESAAKCVLVGLGMMVAGLGVIFSLSRSGIAAAVAGLAVFALLARSRFDGQPTGVIELRRHGNEPSARVQREAKRAVRRVWAFSLFVAAVTIWIGMNPVVQRFGGLSDLWEAENGRQQVWLDSFGAVKDFWLTGSGLGSFQHVFPIYRSFGGVHFYTHAHNDYLQLLIELGLPGLVLVLWLIVSVWIAARRARSGLQGDAASLYLHAGYCAAAAAIALHSLTDFSLHLPSNAALLSVMLGVVVGFDRKNSEESGQSWP